MEGVTIRPEEPGDRDAVAYLNELAFGQPDEARMVEAVRELGVRTVSLVAERSGEVVGHILFSPVTVESGEETIEFMGLAPMAVAPGHQRRGIGSALVRAGLDACRAIGETAVFVLGHPEYYPRFGFCPAAPLGLHFSIEAYDPAFFVTELVPGALAGRAGHVRYLPPFEDDA